MIHKIKVHLSIGFGNASHDEVIEVEVDDDATEKDINDAKDQALEDWGANYIDMCWSDIETE